MIDALAQFPESEIFAWREISDDLMDEAPITDLWNVAYLIGCGSGDDGFADFRAGLGGQGKDVFEKAVADPECLVDVIETGKEEQAGDSSLWHVGIGAYELKTGRSVEEMPSRSRPLPRLKGEARDGDAKRVHIPGAAARFGKRCLEMPA